MDRVNIEWSVSELVFVPEWSDPDVPIYRHMRVDGIHATKVLQGFHRVSYDDMI